LHATSWQNRGVADGQEPVVACVRCGSATVAGHVVSANGGGMGWIDGEPGLVRWRNIVLDRRMRLWGPSRVKGHRCLACRLIFFGYGG
jgi:hypothetical protein